MSLNRWRQKVLKRDNYICRKCGRQENLVAHHIKSQFLYPRLKLKVGNGITLCRQCHTAQKDFSLRLFYPTSKGYLPLMPTMAEIRKRDAIHKWLHRWLKAIPPEFRDSYRSRPYKVRKTGTNYWVRIPPIWLDREIRRLHLSLQEFITRFKPEWTYYDDFGGGYLRFVEATIEKDNE